MTYKEEPSWLITSRISRERKVLGLLTAQTTTAFHDIRYALHEFPKMAALEDEVRAAFHMFVEHPIQCALFKRRVYLSNGIGPPRAALIPGDGTMTVDFMAQSGDSALASYTQVWKRAGGYDKTICIYRIHCLRESQNQI